jgi:hypothetical protein
MSKSPRRKNDTSTDAAYLAEIDRRAEELDRERQALTAERRRVADRLRKREREQAAA